MPNSSLLCASIRYSIASCTYVGFLLQGLNEDVNTVQAALSEKVGHFLQHTTTFVAGIIIAFVGGWDMTLVSCPLASNLDKQGL